MIMFFSLFFGGINAKADEEIPASAFGNATVYEYILSVADSNSDGILMKSEAETVEIIDLQNKGINSLVGLEYCVNATGIYLNDNIGLTNISVLGNMEKLQDIRIRNTSISNLNPLKDNQNIYMLLMENSQIESIAVLTGMSKLQILEIANTKVTDISAVANMPSLMELDLYGCTISDYSPLMSVKGLSAFKAPESNFSDLLVLENSASTLKEIRLSYSEIQDISVLSKFTQLEFVDVSNNKIGSCPDLSALTKLEKFWINNNNISSIPGLSSMVNLKWLDISMNKFTELPDMSKLTKLEKFWCGTNLLTKIPDLSECRLLTTFLIAENNLSREEINNAYTMMPESITSDSEWKKTIGLDTQPGIGENEGNQGEESYRDVISDSGDEFIISGNLGENVYVEGEKIEDVLEYQHIIDYVSKEIEDILDIKIYNIYLYEKGKENTTILVQPNGTVEVKIKLEDDNYTYHVYREEDDGKLVKLNSYVKDGYLHFESDHFSIFTVVMTKLFGEEDTSLHNNKDSNNDDEKQLEKNESKIMYIVIFGVMIVIVLVVFYEMGIYKGKKESREDDSIKDIK